MHARRSEVLTIGSGFASIITALAPAVCSR